MAITLTTALKNMNEDLPSSISNVAPSSVPVTTSIGKTSASQPYHEVLTDTLNPPNKDNAREEGADAVDPSNTLVDRLGNWTQIYAKEVKLSGTADAVKLAGMKEFSRQLANVQKELKTDIEASIVSNNASVSGSTRKSAGLESFIKTNAIENGGSTAGFAANLIPAPTDVAEEDLVVISEEMVQELAQTMYLNGAEIKDLYVNYAMKAKLSAILSGNASRWNNAKEKAATSAVDYYDTDFGEFKVKPHRMIRTSTLIAIDPEFVSWATLRAPKYEDLGKRGDARWVQLITEGTLEVRNEAALGKIANVKIA